MDRGVKDLDITLSELPPQADPVSGKFKHFFIEKKTE